MKVLPSGVDVGLGDDLKSNRAPRVTRPPLIPEYTGTETILLVDDEPVIRDILTATLQRYGYSVLTAEDGEDAIALAEEFQAPIHLLLSDVVMPKLDGCRLFAELRRWYPSVGVLLMSGYADGVQSALDVDAEATFFIAKPFRMDALAAAVRSAIDSRPRRLVD